MFGKSTGLGVWIWFAVLAQPLTCSVDMDMSYASVPFLVTKGLKQMDLWSPVVCQRSPRGRHRGRGLVEWRVKSLK